MTAQEAYEAALDAQKAMVYGEIENATKQGCFSLNVPDEEITPYVYRNLLRDGFMVEIGIYKEKMIAIIKWEYSIKWETKSPPSQRGKEIRDDWDEALEVASRLFHSKTDWKTNCIYKENCGMFSAITDKNKDFEVPSSREMKEFFKKHRDWFGCMKI